MTMGFAELPQKTHKTGFELVVYVWTLDTGWEPYLRRGGLISKEQAEMLGQEEVARLMIRQGWRRVFYEVLISL